MKKFMLLALMAFISGTVSLQALEENWTESDSTHLTPGQHRYYNAMRNDEGDTSAYFSSSSSNQNNSTSDSMTIPKPAQAPSDQSMSNQPQMSDEEITQKLKSALKNDSSLSDSAKNLRVLVTFGNVTLSGTVNGTAEKTKIEQLAKKISGVKSVANRVDVISNQ